MIGQLDSIHSRHHHIDHDEVHPHSGRVHGIEGFFTVLGLQHTVAGLAQHSVGDSAGVSLVIDHENRGSRSGERSGQAASLAQGTIISAGALPHSTKEPTRTSGGLQLWWKIVSACPTSSRGGTRTPDPVINRVFSPIESTWERVG